MNTAPAIRRLLRATHFHQPEQAQPRARQVPAGNELVELVTGGSGAIEHDGELIPIQPGALVWHVAGDRSICRSTPEAPYRCLAADFAVDPAATPSRRVPRLTHWTDLDAVASFTRELVRRVVDEAVDRDSLTTFAYGTLLFRARLWLRGHQADLPAPLRRVTAHLDRHASDDNPIEALAELAGWSVPHLHGMFKKHLGTTPHRYLLERRLRAAKERLLSGDGSIGVIAERSGFSSATSFCRSFKQAVGQSPEAWRRAQAEAW